LKSLKVRTLSVLETSCFLCVSYCKVSLPDIVHCGSVSNQATLSRCVLLESLRLCNGFLCSSFLLCDICSHVILILILIFLLGVPPPPPFLFFLFLFFCGLVFRDPHNLQSGGPGFSVSDYLGGFILLYPYCLILLFIIQFSVAGYSVFLFFLLYFSKVHLRCGYSLSILQQIPYMSF
jgi:hypothetical protein